MAKTSFSAQDRFCLSCCGNLRMFIDKCVLAVELHEFRTFCCFRCGSSNSPIFTVLAASPCEFQRFHANTASISWHPDKQEVNMNITTASISLHPDKQDVKTSMLPLHICSYQGIFATTRPWRVCLSRRSWPTILCKRYA